MKNLKNSTSFKTIAIEFFSIVMGVLLALGVNQWRESINNQDRADAALINIENEMLSNQNSLKLVFKNNKSTLDLINTPNPGNDSNGTYIPAIQLQETAWNTMLNSGISSNIDYDILLQLSSTYSMQGVYKTTAQSFINANLTLSAFSIVLDKDVKDDTFIKGFGETLRMLNLIEQHLIDSYEKSLDTLRKENE